MSEFKSLLADSPITQRIISLNETEQNSGAALLLALYLNPDEQNRELRNFINFFRLVLLENSGRKVVSNLEDADFLSLTAKNRLHDTQIALSELNLKFDEAVERFDNLAELYETKLQLDAPAEYWDRLNVSFGYEWKIYFILFVGMMLVPMLAVTSNWDAFIAFAEKYILGGTTSFSIGALVFVSVPILAYGWILKHISRIFVQSLENSSDAKFRSMFAKTFLSLANKTGEMNEKDKAIVLNALFRSPVAGKGDDGPPMGLVDLIKKS